MGENILVGIVNASTNFSDIFKVTYNVNGMTPPYIPTPMSISVPQIATVSDSVYINCSILKPFRSD